MILALTEDSAIVEKIVQETVANDESLIGGSFEKINDAAAYFLSLYTNTSYV